MSATGRFYKSDSGLHDNTVVVLFEKAGVPAPLTGVTRITCELQPSGAKVDSVDSSDAITWAADGTITLDFAKHDFGSVEVSGEQRAYLDAYDPGHPGGQTLSHSAGLENKLTIHFLDNP